MSPFFCGFFVGQNPEDPKKIQENHQLTNLFPAQIENMQRKNFPTSTLNTTSSMGIEATKRL